MYYNLKKLLNNFNDELIYFNKDVDILDKFSKVLLKVNDKLYKRNIKK